MIPWIVFTLALATILHYIALAFVPRIMMKRTVAGLQRLLGGDGWNRMSYGGLSGGRKRVARTSPDVASTFGTYNVAPAPLRIQVDVPSGDSYWSLALYAWNTQNFYVVNDRTAPSPTFTLVVVPRGSHHQPAPGEHVVIAPTPRGMIVQRMILRNPASAAEIARVRTALRKTTLVP
jgi:uncharacterized membrane protein